MRTILALLCLCALSVPARTAWADDAGDKAAIAGRLRAFAQAFDARDRAAVCDIFAPDLIALIPGMPETSRTALCGNLSRLLARPDLALHYDDPDIREIILSGDLAVVRLVWTLTARRGKDEDKTEETGLDIFQHAADGQWSIIRFATFTMRPNKILN